MTILDSPQAHKLEQLAAGWHDDPQGKHAKRYFDGRAWTDHVTHFGPSPCQACGHLR